MFNFKRFIFEVIYFSVFILGFCNIVYGTFIIDGSLILCIGTLLCYVLSFIYGSYLIFNIYFKEFFDEK